MRVDSWLKIGPDDGLNYDLLMTKLTVPNPEFQSRIRLGYSTNGVSRLTLCICLVRGMSG